MSFRAENLHQALLDLREAHKRAAAAHEHAAACAERLLALQGEADSGRALKAEIADVFDLTLQQAAGRVGMTENGFKMHIRRHGEALARKSFGRWQVSSAALHLISRSGRPGSV